MSNEWIEWNGGDCPISGDAVVDLKMRNSFVVTGQIVRGLDWNHHGNEADIIAYRLSEPAEEEAMMNEFDDYPTVKESFTVHHDMVNSPPHYQLRPGYEVYDLRQDLADKADRLSVPLAEYGDWDRALEYLIRMWDKNMLEDALKARWYLNKLIEKLEDRDE